MICLKLALIIPQLRNRKAMDAKKTHLYVWSAMVKRLHRRPDLSQDAKQLLEQHLKACAASGFLGKAVKLFCIARRQRNKDRVTIIVSLRSDLKQLLDHVKAWFLAHGGNEFEDYEGPPPKGPWIRRIDEYAQRLE